MPEEKKAQLLPKTYFHLLFKAYTEIVNNDKQNSDSFEFERPYCDLFYEMCDTDQKVMDIARIVTNDEANSGCCINVPAEFAKFDLNPKKLINFVNLYLDNIINADELIIPSKEKQSRLDCARVLPYKKQIQIFKKIIDNNLGEDVKSFYFDFSMLKKYGGDGQSVHKRFCIDELLLILQREKLIDKIEIHEGKDYYDEDYNGKRAQLPFYKLTKIKKINYTNGFWFNTINKTIGYKDNEPWDLYCKNSRPIEKTHLLHILISNQGNTLSDDDLIKELAEQGIEALSTKKLTNLRSDVMSLITDIDDEKIFEITRKKINNVWSYYLTSKNKTN